MVLAAIEAALKPEFSMHGLLCTLWFSGPVVIVNGPVTKRIGMNWGGNALGQGNRANATIGRALQPVIRNVGGAILVLSPDHYEIYRQAGWGRSRIESALIDAC